MTELPDLVEIYAGMICADVIRYQHKDLTGHEFVNRIEKHVRDIFKMGLQSSPTTANKEMEK